MKLNLCKNQKTWITLLAVTGGVTAVCVASAAIWNSRSMRASRAVKRTGRILYRVGTAMRNISETAEI